MRGAYQVARLRGIGERGDDRIREESLAFERRLTVKFGCQCSEWSCSEQGGGEPGMTDDDDWALESCEVWMTMMATLQPAF